MTQNATVQSPGGGEQLSDADRIKWLLDAAESVEDGEKTLRKKAWEQVAAKNAAEAAKDAKVDAEIEEMERDLSQRRTKKSKGRDPSPLPVAGPSLPARLPPSIGGIQSTKPSPQWARTYQRGMLNQLGLKRGEWGNSITADVPGKMERLGNANSSTEMNGTERKAFSWNWGLYTLLAKIPGGRASLEVLYRMCLEWCDLLEETKRSNGSCRHSLSTQPCFISENGVWRLAIKNEEKVKKPGPPKEQDPADSWKAAKVGATKASAAKGPTNQKSESATSKIPGVSQPPTTHFSPPRPSLSNIQQIELPSPTGSSSSQSSTPISPSLSTQSCPSKIQSPTSPPPRAKSTDLPPVRRKHLPSEKPETFKEDVNKQSNHRAPDMANSLTVPESQSTPIKPRSRASARGQRTLLPSRKGEIVRELAEMQDGTHGLEMVNTSTALLAPFTVLSPASSALSLGIRLPPEKSKTTKEDANNQDNTRVPDMAKNSPPPLLVVGFTAINHQPSVFTPINSPSSAPSAKRKREKGDHNTDPAAKSQCVE
jgi:hypothetical protein